MTNYELRQMYVQAKAWLCMVVGVNPSLVLDPAMVEVADMKDHGQCSDDGIKISRKLTGATREYVMSVMVHEVAHWLDFLANGWCESVIRYEWLAMTAECLYDHEATGYQPALNLCHKDPIYNRPVTNFLRQGPEYARTYLAEKLAALQPIPELVG